MRAVTLVGEQLRVVERPDPVPGPRDVVVRVHGAGLNAADLLQRRGFYPAPPGWPTDIPGMEMAGTVVARGSDVHSTNLGARVCAIVGGGAQATHCVVPAEHVLDVPASVALTEAGGFAEAFTTAADALLTGGPLRPGTRVLVSGAAGGVGSAVIQLARAWGAHPIAVTRDSQFHEQLVALGAAEVTTVDEVAQLEPVNYVVELLGAVHLEQALKVLAPHANVVVIGIGGGARVELDLLRMMAGRWRVTGSTLRARSREEKSDVAAILRRDVLPLWTSGDVRVVVQRTFVLEDAVTAYDAFGERGKFGKLILTTNAGDDGYSPLTAGSVLS